MIAVVKGLAILLNMIARLGSYSPTANSHSTFAPGLGLNRREAVPDSGRCCFEEVQVVVHQIALSNNQQK